MRPYLPVRLRLLRHVEAGIHIRQSQELGLANWMEESGEKETGEGGGRAGEHRGTQGRGDREGRSEGQGSYNTYKYIGNEHAMKTTLLEELGKLDPVLHVVKVGRMVVRVLPKTGGLMARAALHKGIEDKLLLGGNSLARGCGGGFGHCFSLVSVSFSF